MSLNCTVSSIQFDNALLDEIKKSSGGDIQSKHFNGIPLQLVLAFKTICCLPDDEVNTRVIAEWYQKMFGVNIFGTSISRNVDQLYQYGFIERILNPHGSRRFSWIKLTTKGRKLQKLFIGSTSDWKDKPRIVVDRNLKTAMRGV